MGSSTQDSFEAEREKENREAGYLAGQFLIAGPAMRDKRFRRTVIYMCVHDSEQAMGIVINKPDKELTLSGMLPQLDVAGDVTYKDTDILHGGPVEMGRGFVLHSREYFDESSSIPLSPTLALSTSKSVLKSLVEPSAPKRAVLALGYAGWQAGQLESEIMSNSWFIAPADEDMIFKGNSKKKWKKALAKIGITPELLSSQAGWA